MESTDLDMGEIFDEDDDDIGAVSALPDLPEYGDEDQDGEGERDNEEAGKVTSTLYTAYR